MKDIERLIDFVRFSHEVRNVKRAMVFEDNYRENDMEHQYQLALVSWFLIENDNLNLDKRKVIALAIIHDTLEAYAGDTIAFADKKTLVSKAEKEATAVQKLKETWPTFSSLHELIDEYEARQTPEAKFVYAMDKLLPIINNYLFDGKAWKNHKVTLEKMKSIKTGEIDANEDVNEYYEELLKILEQRPELFGKPDEAD